MPSPRRATNYKMEILVSLSDKVAEAFETASTSLDPADGEFSTLYSQRS